MMLTLRLHPADSVVIARAALAPGTVVPGEATTVREAIPLGHKLATRTIASGEPVRRYGQVIGFATRDIAPGEHVHTQNLAMGEFEREYAFSTLVEPPTPPSLPRPSRASGARTGRWRRATTSASSTSVNCSATVAGYVADAFRRRPFSSDAGPLAEYPNVDGVVALTHKTGCGMASDGEGMERAAADARRLLAPPQLRLRDRAGPRLRGQPDRPDRRDAEAPARAPAAGHDDPGHGRHRPDGGARHRAREGAAARGQSRAPPDAAGVAPHRGPAVRRIGRLLRHHREPGAGRGLRPAGAQRRDGHPVGDAPRPTEPSTSSRAAR